MCIRDRLYRPEFLAAIDWALAPNEDERPQSVAEWRESIAGTGLANTTRTVPAFDAPSAPQPSKSVLTFDPALLKKLETALAQHLGPIAPVVVKNAAKKAATQADLVQLVAQEITCLLYTSDAADERSS